MTDIKPGHISGSGRTVQCFDGGSGSTVSFEYCLTCGKCKPITAKARQQRQRPYVRKSNRRGNV